MIQLLLSCRLQLAIILTPLLTNEVIARSSTFTSYMSLSQSENKRAEAEISRRMTLGRAIHTVRHMKHLPHAVADAIDANLAQTGVTHFRHGLRSSRRRSGGGGGGGLEGAKTKLNEMIHETQVKLDLELIRCSAYERTQLALLEKLRQDISTFDSAAAAGSAEMLRAQAEISVYETKLPATKNELEEHLAECAKSKAELEKQLKIVKADIAVMEKIMAMTQCKTSMLLLQCRDPMSGRSFTQIGSPDIREAMSDLQHPEAQELLQSGFPDYGSDDEDGNEESDEPREVVGTGVSDYPPETEDGLPDTFFQEEEETDYANENDGADWQYIDQAPLPSNATVPPNREKQRAKCSIAASPACEKLRERFMDIATGIEDKKDELEEELQALVKRCADGKASLESQIALYEQMLKKEETALAQATSEKNVNEEQSRLTTIEHERATKEYNQMMSTCKLNIENFRTEKCGLEKIRGELYKMNRQTVFFQDCEVSDWKSQECSVTCGGGTQIMTRSITVYPNGGAACPTLKSLQSCNEDACPVDCVLADWSGWSSCSADCGGGVRSKSRAVITPSEHGGEPCGEQSKTEACNVQACDVPCTLSAWTAWGACSKACDGGSATRTKQVVQGAVGQGTCPAPRNAKRLQMKPCNTAPCANSTIDIMQCVSKLDVVLLLDGSGSLGKDGWDATVAAGANIAKSMGPDVRLAALLFSGPLTYPNLWACTGVTAGNPDMKRDCGIEWVEHFTDNADSVASKIQQLSFPAKTTLTSLALSTAETELSNGRSDAQSVVIILTDGNPMSCRRTGIAARRLKRKARVIWVPVGRYVKLGNIRRWASFPWRENVVKVRNFNDLNTAKTIYHILSDACPQVAAP